jgi:hypothetical protein
MCPLFYVPVERVQRFFAAFFFAPFAAFFAM